MSKKSPDWQVEAGTQAIGNSEPSARIVNGDATLLVVETWTCLPIGSTASPDGESRT